MRYVVFGAGAVGGAIGGLLHRAGHEVALVARGDHLEALRRDGLRVMTPDWDDTLRIRVGASVAEVGVAAGDVIIVATKSQHAQDALRTIAAQAPPGVAVACAQNGVESERMALRRFAHVLGMFVFFSATHLAPGTVQLPCAPTIGVLDVGVYPRGSDDRARTLATHLGEAGFASRAVPDVMRWKHAKLLGNLGNAVEAALRVEDRDPEFVRTARDEALACYTALGISHTPHEEMRERARAIPPLRPVGGQDRRGGSTWQSLARGTGSVEVDYLNGEIVLMGRLAAVPTPMNETLQRVVNAMARDGREPATMTAAELRAELSVTLATP